MKAVYRRDPRLYYGPKKTHGWIPTLQTQIFGVPVCDPQAVLDMIEALADEVLPSGNAVLVGTMASAQSMATQGGARMDVVQGEAVAVCS